MSLQRGPASLQPGVACICPRKSLHQPLCSITLPCLQRSSGKGWGLPLRYPSHDGPLSARGPAASFAALAAAEEEGATSDGGSSGMECDSDADGAASAGGASPARAAAAGGFAVLANGSEGEDDEAAEEESVNDELPPEAQPQQQQQQQLAGDSGYESEAEAEEADGGTTAAPAAPSGAFSFGWAPASPALLERQQQVQPGAAPLFSFAAAGGGAAVAPRSPPLDLPPGARASTASLAALHASGGLGGFGGAGLAPADSEEDAQFFSAVPSRATSAGLTAYASARSLRCAVLLGLGMRCGCTVCKRLLVLLLPGLNTAAA